MSKRMYADFTDEAYEAFQKGEAVDNNGFRSKKGNFYPDQPTFSPMNERQEQLKDAGVELLIAAGGYLAFQVVLPEIKRFNHEKVYPFFAEKWDELQERHKAKKAAKQAKAQVASQPAPQAKPVAEDADEEEAVNTAKIINLEDYRKRA